MTQNADTRVSRRAFLATSAAASAIVISGGAIIKPTEAWGYEVKALKPETMRSLVQMARDIYPHDRLADRYLRAGRQGSRREGGRRCGA